MTLVNHLMVLLTLLPPLAPQPLALRGSGRSSAAQKRTSRLVRTKSTPPVPPQKQDNRTAPMFDEKHHRASNTVPCCLHLCGRVGLEAACVVHSSPLLARPSYPQPGPDADILLLLLSSPPSSSCTSARSTAVTCNKRRHEFHHQCRINTETKLLR